MKTKKLISSQQFKKNGKSKIVLLNCEKTGTGILDTIKKGISKVVSKLRPQKKLPKELLAPALKEYKDKKMYKDFDAMRDQIAKRKTANIKAMQEITGKPNLAAVTTDLSTYPERQQKKLSSETRQALKVKEPKKALETLVGKDKLEDKITRYNKKNDPFKESNKRAFGVTKRKINNITKAKVKCNSYNDFICLV